MALISCDFFSEVLEVGASMTVLLPERATGQIGLDGTPSDGRPPPVLYLLHGLSDDHTTWSRRTSIERYAAPLGLAVVMPGVQRSFYADEVHGSRYWTFLHEELPEVVASLFRVSTRREDTFVAGLSMGGYGALKWALREPSRFAAVASMSGVVDVQARADERGALFDQIFGGLPTADDDLFALLARADPGQLPPMHLSCGTEDRLLAGSQEFADAARERGLDPVVDFRPGGHEWGFWDTEIAQVLSWLPLAHGAPDTPEGR